MGDTMNLRPIHFNLAFFILVLFLGIDFALSGYLAIRDRDKYLNKPRLLGLLIMIANQKVYERSKKQNYILKIMYSYDYSKIYTLVGGLLIIVGGLIAIYDILLTLW
jgi:hypothetical protein